MYLSLNQPALHCFLFITLLVSNCKIENCEHKFRHNFHDTLTPLCYCILEHETTSHYLLCCHNFSSARSVLMNDVNLIVPIISRLNETALRKILLYVDSKKTTLQNSKMLQSTIKYIYATKQFDESLS